MSSVGRTINPRSNPETREKKTVLKKPVFSRLFSHIKLPTNLPMKNGLRIKPSG